ncbi:uncharacterized protein LOC127843941 [Dreissena polymorpha]|uniref:Tyrosinase copper-binding domain-containing protein n=1 Tax=Dreissena polymorpha TaxID=45954 RepID=A0A9D4E7C8_DREPO|nr:uncharacterized protein LOC127843941 [Dreissena polymorpha]KAH3774103.1 hypothetical protein DPMN_175475 [Dreissena polymorpha]
MHTAAVCLFLLSVLITYVYAVVETSDAPLHMAHCYGVMKKRTTLAKTPASAIQHFCDNNYMWMKAQEINIKRGVPQTAQTYIQHLYEGVVNRATLKQRVRRKRQAGDPTPAPTPKVRKEIRMMSDAEIKLFFDAVNSAKQNTTIAPNKYDALAEMHTGITSLSAHGGCNFHGWHRVYLHMFENALREEGPQFAEVTVPYWDSRLDNYMTGDKTRSALFSDRLMGNCSGQARGGIMRNGWESTTGTITRNCGTDGPLLNDEMVNNITKQTRMREICGEDSNIDHDWEFHHNGIHRWIDGQMAILDSAVYDPIFWIHHTFVDKVWEDFRKNQKRAGVDSQTDYPTNPTVMGAHELHLPEAALGFSDLRVIDGLSDIYTEEFYTYDPSPTCVDSTVGCGSKYLKCVENTDKKIDQSPFRCVARTLKEVEEYEAELNKPKPVECARVINITLPEYTHNSIDPVQNTFCMNGNSDISQWVYIPIKLILRRPPDYKSYGSYPVNGGKLDTRMGDIYSPSAYSNVQRYLRTRPEQPATYDECLESSDPTNTIYVKSVGLNYAGVYKEYAIMDKRLAITVATAYLAVRKPQSPTDTSVAILHAQDSCGRVCKPVCKVPGTEIFRPCSGAIKVTGGKPLQFGNTFGDAVLGVFDFDTDANCPQVKTETIIMSFYCDYGTEWFWPSVDPALKNEACDLGNGCKIAKSCAAAQNCTNGEVIECAGLCHMYAACFNQKLMLYQCRRGERYLKGRGCVDSRTNPCEYATTGPRGRREALRKRRNTIQRTKKINNNQYK